MTGNGGVGGRKRGSDEVFVEFIESSAEETKAYCAAAGPGATKPKRRS